MLHLPRVATSCGGGRTRKLTRREQAGANDFDFGTDSTRRLVPGRVQRLVRRWTLPNGAPRSFLSLPSVFKNCRDVAAELLSHPLTCSVNLVENRVTLRCLLNHRPPFLPAFFSKNSSALGITAVKRTRAERGRRAGNQPQRQPQPIRFAQVRSSHRIPPYLGMSSGSLRFLTSSPGPDRPSRR